MSYEELMEEISALGWFESLVHLPAKPRDPDWPIWSASATKNEKRFTANGETDIQALERLLEQLKK